MTVRNNQSVHVHSIMKYNLILDIVLVCQEYKKVMLFYINIKSLDITLHTTASVYKYFVHHIRLTWIIPFYIGVLLSLSLISHNKFCHQ